MDAELGQDRVDGPDLYAPSPRPVADLRGLEVVVAIWIQEGKGAEARDDLLLIAWAPESLEEARSRERSRL